MKWSIEYFNSELENEILSLPEGLLARYLRLTDLMIEFGYISKNQIRLQGKKCK